MLEKYSTTAVLGGAVAIPLSMMLAAGVATAAEAPKNLKELIAGAKKEKVYIESNILKIQIN